MDNSNIAWTDGTWNPWLGCDKVGPECENCYIDRTPPLRRRKKEKGLEAFGNVSRTETSWNEPLKVQRRAAEFVAQHGRRYRFFTCSLSDFFHRKADKWRPEAWEIIRRCPDVDFLILTKRAHRIAECLPADWGTGYPNVWLGVSIGMMETAHRADKLRKIPAVVRFISAEPLLGSLAGLNLDEIHWLIAGGESGDSYRYMKTGWADELRRKCESSGVAFFFKQGSGLHSGEEEDLLGGRIYQNWPIQIKQAPTPPGEAEPSTAALAPTLAKQNSVFELLSALQKGIRRNDEREALLAAWQLDANTGDFKVAKKFGGQLWSAIRKICSEDVGIANFGLVGEIRRLQANWIKATRTNSKHEPWRLFTVHAVILLCQSPKSRLVDHACFVTDGRLEKLLDEIRKEPQPHPIPAYAHDGLHTVAGVGKSKAEATADFLVREDAVLSPRAEDVDDPYREEIFEALREARSAGKEAA